MSKKILIMMLLALSVFNIQTIAKQEKQYFKIYADAANEKEAYKIKNQLIKEFQILVEGLDESQYTKALETNLPNNKNIQYVDHVIEITLGDGNGVVLEGELKTNYCQGIEDEPLETRFFFLELFD